MLTTDEAQQAEAIQMLTTIYAFRTNYIPAPTSAAEVNLVLGQLYHAYGHLDRAREYATKALEGQCFSQNFAKHMNLTLETLTFKTVYEAALGREHSLTIEARSFFKFVVGEIQHSSRVTGGGISSAAARRSSTAQLNSSAGVR
jgi:hypothetical protein